jgi:UDP-N-acetylglucosamine 2-epimerase (non-hydrolysing)
VVITGNAVVDAVTQGSQLHLFFNSSDLKNADFNNIRMVLATSHRRDSWGIALGNICEANNEVVQNNPDIVVIYPVHPNPLSKNTVKQILAGNKRTHPVKPLNYVTFISLMKKSYMIVTDSGGLQREKPVMTPFEGFGPPTQLSLNYYAKINNLLSSGI